MQLQPNIYLERWERINSILHQSGLDGFILNPGATLTYIIGEDFHLSERPIVAIIKNNSPLILILPELEVSKIAQIQIPLQLYPYSETPEVWQSAFTQAIHAAGLKSKSRVGIDPLRFRYLEMSYLQNALPGLTLSDGRQYLKLLRLVKDEYELSMIRNAVKIAEEGLLNTISLIKAGMTERELASELVFQLYRSGCDTTLPFAPIIASGPNSTKGHAIPTDKKLSAKELLVIDWGAKYQGYCSDLTRSFGILEVDRKYREIASIVHQANNAARSQIKPGISCAIIDKAARDVIEQAGFGKYFIHRTGHGIGLEEHEEPYIHANNSELLEKGMTFTVEPGIYLDGEGGIRIEDNVVITQDGVETFSNLTRELVIVG